MTILWRNRSFLFLFLGRLVTNIGDSIYYVAAMWLVYELGGSTFYSGLAGFLTLLPMALQFLTGPFIDHWNIKTTLITTQLLQCVIILILPIAYAFDTLTVAMILIVMPILSFIEQFAYPAQVKALPKLLEKQELVKGNSIFSVAYQGVDLIFNSLSGILVAMIGALSLFMVDSITFALAAILFSLVKLPSSNIKTKQTQSVKWITSEYIAALKEGFSIVFHSLLGTFLIATVIANFAIGAAQAVLPAFSQLAGGATLYGFYLAALSTGSLLGALISNWLGKFPVGRLTITCFTIGGLCWMISPLLASNIAKITFFGLAWIPVGATNVMFAAVSQTIIPQAFLGRINTVTRSMSVAAMPIGSLLGGALASVISPVIIFSITGIGFLCVAIVWLLHASLRGLPSVGQIGPEAFRITFTNRKEGSNR